MIKNRITLIKKYIIYTTIISLFIISFSSILSLFAKHYWLFDLLTNFKLQYVTVLTVTTLLLIIFKNKKLSIISLIFLTMNLYPILPYYFPYKKISGKNEDYKKSKSDNIKIMLFNVYKKNKNKDKTTQFITQQDNDVMFLLETNHQWLKHLKPIISKYEYNKTLMRDDGFAFIFLSKIKPEWVKVLYFKKLPVMHARININNKLINFIGVHPCYPIGKKKSLQRNGYLLDLINYINSIKKKYATKNNNLSESIIVIGDLNSTPFSYHFKKLIKFTSLRDSSLGLGLSNTWLAKRLPLNLSKLPIFQLPIDHILISEDIKVNDRKVNKINGSDHFPISLKFSLQNN